MGIKSEIKNGERCPNSLTDYVKRGSFFAAKDNSGKSVIVNHGCPEGYPLGDTVIRIEIDSIPNLIAVLKGVVESK